MNKTLSFLPLGQQKKSDLFLRTEDARKEDIEAASAHDFPSFSEAWAERNWRVFGVDFLFFFSFFPLIFQSFFFFFPSRPRLLGPGCFFQGFQKPCFFCWTWFLNGFDWVAGNSILGSRRNRVPLFGRCKLIATFCTLPFFRMTVSRLTGMCLEGFKPPGSIVGLPKLLIPRTTPHPLESCPKDTAGVLFVRGSSTKISSWVIWLKRRISRFCTRWRSLCGRWAARLWFWKLQMRPQFVNLRNSNRSLNSLAVVWDGNLPKTTSHVDWARSMWLEEVDWGWWNSSPGWHFSRSSHLQYSINAIECASRQEYEKSGCDFSDVVIVTIPNTVDAIEARAFENCRSLVKVTIPESVTYIGERAFSNCRSLESLTIPNSVTAIGFSAFASCSSLTSLTISNSVTEIGIRAFQDCSSLTEQAC